MSIRILHAADLHLDSPFEGLDARRAAVRRAEQRKLLEELVRLVESERVQLVLLAGDLLDSDAAYKETADVLTDAFRRMAVPVFIAPGNHDYYYPGAAYASMPMPENVHIFTEPELRRVHLPELGVSVWGAAFTDTYSDSLLENFSPPADGCAETQVMVMHGETAPRSPYNGLTEAQLAGSGMDYTALGHVHSFSGKRQAGRTVYAWPGCPEGRGFDETGEKGVILADVEPGNTEIRFVPIPGRRYEILNFAFSSAAELKAAVQPYAEDILRVVLTGEVDEPVNLAALRETLSPLCFALQLRDNTAIRRDIWEKTGEDTLRGQFLSRLRRRYEQASAAEERELVLRAVRYGLHAMDGGEEI